jgi:hypothetical protein
MIKKGKKFSVDPWESKLKYAYQTPHFNSYSLGKYI